MENKNSKPKKSFSIFCCFSTNDSGRRRRKAKQEERNKQQSGEKSNLDNQPNTTIKEITNINHNEKFKNDKNKVYEEIEFSLNENNNSKLLTAKQNINNVLIFNNMININDIDLKNITTYKRANNNLKTISPNIVNKNCSSINNKENYKENIIENNNEINKENNNISIKKEESIFNIDNLSEIKSKKTINNIQSENLILNEAKSNNMKPLDNNENNNLINKNMSINHKGTQSLIPSDFNKMNLFSSNKNDNICIKDKMLTNVELKHKLSKSQIIINNENINNEEHNNNNFIEIPKDKENKNITKDNNKINNNKNDDIYFSDVIAIDKAKSAALPLYEQSNVSVENKQNIYNYSTVFITQDAKANNNFYFSKPNQITQKNNVIVKNNTNSQKSLDFDKVSQYTKKYSHDVERHNKDYLSKSSIFDIENNSNKNKDYFYKTDKNLTPFKLKNSYENNIKKYQSDIEPKLNYINNTLIAHDKKVNDNLMNKITTINNDTTELEDNKKENNIYTNKNSNNNLITEDNNISESLNKNNKSINTNKKLSQEILITKDDKNHINDTQIQEAYENINCMEDEIEDEMGETDEMNKNINDTRSIISSYVMNHPSIHENSVSLNRESLINFNDYIQHKMTITDDTEIEITNENVKNFKNFIETPRASGVYNKYNPNSGYNNMNQNNKIKNFPNNNQILMREIEKLFQSINKNDDFIKKTNDKINDIAEKMKVYEEWNKKYELWIEKEEEESEVLVHMLNFLNKNKK